MRHPCRKTFYEPSDEDEAGSVIPVNSTELRHAGFGLTVLEPSIRTACNAELEPDGEDGGDVDGEGIGRTMMARAATR